MLPQCPHSQPKTTQACSQLLLSKITARIKPPEQYSAARFKCWHLEAEPTKFFRIFSEEIQRRQSEDVSIKVDGPAAAAGRQQAEGGAHPAEGQGYGRDSLTHPDV